MIDLILRTLVVMAVCGGIISALMIIAHIIQQERMK